MPSRKLFIHVGPHKTGTTTIQRGLVANKAILEKRGFHFPDVCFNYDGHHNLVHDLMGTDKFKPWLGGLKDIVEFAENSEGNIILSSEAFDRITTRAPLLKLKNALGKMLDIQIIGYLRPQDELLESFWKTDVMFHNLEEDFDKWLEKALTDWPFLKYDEWLEPFCAVFGKANVHFNIYDPGTDDLLTQFLKQCGLKNLKKLEIAKRENVSIPSVIFEWLRILYIEPFLRRNTNKEKTIPVMMLGLKMTLPVVKAFAKQENIKTDYTIYNKPSLHSVRRNFQAHNQKAANALFGREELFPNQRRLTPLPGKAIDLLTPNQALRLGGKLIEFEQSKSGNRKLKKTKGAKIKSENKA